jgi:hypothetical protein
MQRKPTRPSIESALTKGPGASRSRLGSATEPASRCAAGEGSMFSGDQKGALCVHVQHQWNTYTSTMPSGSPGIKGRGPGPPGLNTPLFALPHSHRGVSHISPPRFSHLYAVSTLLLLHSAKSTTDPTTAAALARPNHSSPQVELRTT